jgi:3-oxoadipate enol-lactonase
MPTLSVHGADLVYQETGHGAPVLLLHGLGANLGTWDAQVAALAPHYRTIAMDLRGSGASRDREHPQGPFSIPQFAADARALLDHLGAVPAHVVGLSLGGMIAFQLAVDAPGQCRSLTIVNSGPAVVPRNLVERGALGMRRVVTQLVGPATFARLLAPKLFPRAEHAALRERFKAMVAANDPKAYVATLDAILGWSVLDRIGTITAPTLVVSADHDYTSVASKAAYVRLMPNARLAVVDDTRHALPMEAPNRFNAVLARFLASVEAGERSP